ncbi:MAG: hypothetical protein ACYC56_13195 [Candidatus Aquicultor sp.]
MNLSNGQSGVSIDTEGDNIIRSAVLANLAVEALVTLTALALMLRSTGMGSALVKKLKSDYVKWRNRTFGPPPPSEEDIKRYEKLTVIEATRILRQAES